MASSKANFDTQHEDMIHDSQLDYYGKRLATCSSDRTIKIFEDLENNPSNVATLNGHEGPVWQVAWSHPKYESLLASCSYDRRVFVWKEVSKGQWQIIHQYQHQASVNSICWAPYEHGLILASASSDCTICVHTFKEGENQWESNSFDAHQIGVNSVSWAPYMPPSSILGPVDSRPKKMLVSGGCDNTVKIWSFSEDSNQWQEKKSFKDHTDWVRDVAWAPSIGLPSSTIATCSQDGKVIIYSSTGHEDWSSKELPKFPDVVWRVSWSITGNILAVSGGDNRVTLWKEGPDAEWTCISSLGEEATQQN